jgi:hypothetical protein
MELAFSIRLSRSKPSERDFHFRGGRNMSDDWIDKLFREKEEREKLDRLSDEAILEKRRRFLSSTDQIKKWLCGILSESIERFNKNQKNPEDKIEIAGASVEGIISAHKRSHPPGDLLVELDTEGERVVCTYTLDRAFQQPGPTTTEYPVSVAANGSFNLYENGKPIPSDKVAQKILGEYFRGIIG